MRLPAGRRWFDPREGLASLTRTDAVLLASFTLLAFAIAVANLGWPAEKYFDEGYFARAGEEYLHRVPQFEWTHPPFTKLLIALSLLLAGDTPFGWRFLNVVAGALEVGLLYAFAKRLTSSTLFAALAALLLTFDGFHFVEQRISTGEIVISTLILTALYAFYRYWLAAQVRIERSVCGRFGRRFWTAIATGVPIAALFSWLANRVPADHTTPIANGILPPAPYEAATYVAQGYAIAFVYAMIGCYPIARLLARHDPAQAATRVSYADGTCVNVTARGPVRLRTPAEDDAPAAAHVTHGSDGSMRYVTPAATAEFRLDGTMRVAGAGEVSARSAAGWLGLLCLALGLLAASKWNGAFDFAVVFVVTAGVAAQRFLRRAALYGNPYGFPLDIVAALIVFVSATIYGLAYLPTIVLGGGHNLTDIVYLQYQMYWYHSGSVHGTHPYMSVWWQWPIMQAPISYYYHDFRTGEAATDGAACCVAEIIALPNPLVFLLGLVSVPYTAWLAWHERNKGYALLAIAYVLQWVPWVHSPRMLFEYHFFPNLAVIALCDTVLLQRIARRLSPHTQWVLGAYAAAVVVLFLYFYPVLAGMPVSYDAWRARMWPDNLRIPYTSWIIPHPDQH
ncbi:MAG: hypothetical protein NVS3B7_01710 [Candidatus Elarobacter sp.]